MAKTGRPLLVREVYSDFRQCKACATEYMYRVNEDGEATNKACPKCENSSSKTIKVYPRKER